MRDVGTCSFKIQWLLIPSVIRTDHKTSLRMFPTMAFVIKLGSARDLSPHQFAIQITNLLSYTRVLQGAESVTMGLFQTFLLSFAFSTLRGMLPFAQYV
jgi:hypothetical protein